MGVPSLNDLAVDGTLNTTNQPATIDLVVVESTLNSSLLQDLEKQYFLVLFLLFQLALSILCVDLLQILCGFLLGRRNLPNLLKLGCHPYFQGIMGIFIQFVYNSVKSSIKPLTRNNLYLVWRVSRGPSFYILRLCQCDLYL